MEILGADGYLNRQNKVSEHVFGVFLLLCNSFVPIYTHSTRHILFYTQMSRSLNMVPNQTLNSTGLLLLTTVHQP